MTLITISKAFATANMIRFDKVGIHGYGGIRGLILHNGIYKRMYYERK